MSTAAAQQARDWVNELIRLESRGHGDSENAMRRLAHRHGVNWRVLWTVKYRKNRDITVGVFEKIRAMHAAEAKRQIERLRHEISISEINGVDVQDIRHQVETLAAELEACLAKRKAG